MLTQEELKLNLTYSQETGLFVRISTGRPAGSVSKALGYVFICICGKQFLAHRLAWLYVHGSWPDGLIDHINQDKKDNRIINLRKANRRQNALNSSVVRAGSGMKGVYYQSNTKKWRAKNGNTHIGYFDSMNEAHQAWLAVRAAGPDAEFLGPV